jgi:hypothetical protein
MALKKTSDKPSINREINASRNPKKMTRPATINQVPSPAAPPPKKK